MSKLYCFEGREVELFEWNGKVLFNPYHVGKCLSIGESAVKMAVSKMNENQVIKLTNSKVNDIDFRKLHNTGENFLTESGVFKLIFKSHKPGAEKFQDWVTDDVLPSINHTGTYTKPKQLQLEEKSYEYKQKKYNGIPVVTTADMEHFTNIPSGSFSYYLRGHKKFFKYGVDYWLLTGTELREFKTRNEPWRNFSKSLILFTKSGVLKLSKLMDGVPAELPCFKKEVKCLGNLVKTYKEKPIIVKDDFSVFTGVDIDKHKLFFRLEFFTPGRDWNGIGQGELREKFEKENHVHYDEHTICYMHESGIRKALMLLNLSKEIEDKIMYCLSEWKQLHTKADSVDRLVITMRIA